jgi:hypothetical protein
MANAFKNTDLVTKFAVEAFLNSLQMGQKVDRQLDDQFTKKVGSSIDVRRPVFFAATDGATISSTPDIEEGIVTVTLDQRKKVNFAVTTQDMTLEVDEFNERYTKPAMEELAQQVESSIADSYKEIANFVGTPGTTPNSFLAVGAAKQKLDEIGVPLNSPKCAFYDPEASVALANSLNAVFPQQIAEKAIENAMITKYAGFEIFENQSLKAHTTGTWSTGSTPLVKGATQDTTYALSKDTDTQSLITDGWAVSTLVLTEGDVFTIAGVNSVNRRTREDTGQLAQFVVRADATSTAGGEATLTIAPAMITSGPYQTVTAAPADDAAISVKTGTEATSYRQNLSFHKNAITLAMAMLDLPASGKVDASRQNFDGVSIRLVIDYDFTDDENLFRFDILYTVKVQNRMFACRTTG